MTSKDKEFKIHWCNYRGGLWGSGLSVMITATHPSGHPKLYSYVVIILYKVIRDLSKVIGVQDRVLKCLLGTL